jgi:hypothetical protein
MKERVVVRIVSVNDGSPIVLITCTGGGRCSEYTNITEASGYRLLSLCERYAQDGAVHRGEGITQLKILLKEVN